MILKNISRKTIPSSDAILCDSIFSRFKGLMFSSAPKALVFRFNQAGRISLHMLFVFFPIDVLFLDEKKKVVDMKENFRPFALYTSKKPAIYAIELEKGNIKKSKTRIGDIISFNG